MRWDAGVELYFVRHRWYDPYLGRFLTRDPIGAFGDLLNLGNPYAFVGNNPWSYVDPWGLEGCPIAIQNWKPMKHLTIGELEWHHLLPQQHFDHPAISDSVRAELKRKHYRPTEFSK